MKKTAAKFTAAVLALTVLLPLQRLAAGETAGLSPALASPAHITQQSAAAPAAQPGTTQKAAATGNALPEAAHPAETTQPQTAPGSDSGHQTASQEPGGDPVGMIEFGGAWAEAALRGINNLTSGVVDTGEEYPEFVFEYDDDAGAHHTIYIGLYFDEATGILFGRNGEGAMRSGFDFDTQQGLMYASYNGWERDFGFCALYDALAPVSATLYDTQRIKFSYGGRDWMVQIWKGFYFGFLTGAEIGIYNKPESRPVEFYDCVEDADMVEMSMRLSKGETLLFERQAQVHWWMNGFVPAGPTPAKRNSRWRARCCLRTRRCSPPSSRRSTWSARAPASPTASKAALSASPGNSRLIPTSKPLCSRGNTRAFHTHKIDIQILGISRLASAYPFS